MKSTEDFLPPVDFMHWNPTCHHNEDLDGLLKRFFDLLPYRKLPLFYLWGHSYEFERDRNWERIEQFCKLVCGREEIWYATNLEIKRYLCAVRSLVCGVEGNFCYNPSAVPVWMEDGKEIVRIAPGETFIRT